MFQRTKNRKAISTVLTTMIILVASVVLGTGVVLYGTSLFQTNAQSQAIATTGTQIWVDSTLSSGWAWGAADVRNSGDKLLSIDAINIRGQAIPFANWYANSSSTITTTQFQSTLLYTKMINPNTGVLDNGTTYGLSIGNQAGWTMTSCPNGSGQNKMIILLAIGQSPTCFNQQSGPVSLAPGQKAIIYFKVPTGLLTSVDAGSSASVSIYAGKVGAPVTVTVAAK
jgi:hypothetical protein